MKVLHLVHQYLPEFVGGTELYTQALTQALAARGWQIGIFHRTYREQDAEPTRQEGDVNLFAAAGGPLTPALRFLATWRQPVLSAQWEHTLDTFAPDLVHVQHLMGLPSMLLDLLHARRIPYVITLLDYWWVCANANLLTNDREQPCAGPQAYLNCTRCAVARAGSPAAWATTPALWGLLADRNRRLRDLLHGAAALLAPSEFVLKWYAAHGAPAHKLRLAAWGVTPPPTLPPRRTVRKAALEVLYVGGLAPNKGVHVVVEALRQVQGDVRLLIGGDETTHPAYVAVLRRQADARVTFLGRLPRTQVWQALTDADVVVVPSLWHETYCLVAREALTAGAPVVASAMGALTEAVHSGVNGLLLPPGDVAAWRATLQELVDAPARLDALRAGVTAPRQFAAHVQEIDALYRELLPPIDPQQAH